MARQIVVEITGNSSGFQKATATATEHASGFGNIMKGIAQGIGQGIFNEAVNAVHYLISAIGQSDQAFKDDEVSVALLRNTLKDTVPHWQAMSKGVEAYVAKQASLGFGAAEVRGSLESLIRVTKNVAEAEKLQSLAEDIARARHEDLGKATDTLSKAWEGNVKALKVLGIELPKHFTHAQLVAAITAKVHGEALAYANTAEGRLAAAHAKETAAWVKIGTIVDKISMVVIPLVVDAFTKVADYVINNVVPAFMQIWNAATQLWSAFTTLLAPAIKYIQDHMSNLKPVMVAIGIAIAVVFGLIVLAVLAVIAIVVLLVAGIVWFAGQVGKNISDIKKFWDSLVSFAKGLPGRITSAVSGMWDGMKNAFKSAMNWIIDKWNGFHLSFPGIMGQGAFSVNMPQIPRFHSGGLVPGSGDTLALLQGGERVIPRNQANGGNTYNLIFPDMLIGDGPALDRLGNMLVQRANFAPGT